MIDKSVFISGNNIMKFVHVQSVLPQEDVIALKIKSGESSVKEAISTAVYHYLKCDAKIKEE
jgi:hypothetical protein